MDPPVPGRRPTDRGGKNRGGRKLGLKTASTHPLAPPSTPPPPVTLPPPPPSVPLPPPPPPVSTSSAPTLGASASNLVALTSPPTAPTSSPTALAFTVPPRPPQGPGWGCIPQNFSSYPGNQQGSNSWIYPLGGFVHMIEQQNYPSPYGENYHLVGQNTTFNPISPPQPASPYDIPSPQSASSYDTPSPQGTEQVTSTNKPVKQRCLRYWTHEEEQRLASSWLEISKDPIHGNDKKGDTFWKEITNEFHRKGNGKCTRETNQLKIHRSRLTSSIGDWNDYWTKVTGMHTSGYSDDMLEEEAQKLYANRHGKNFTLIHWWKIPKDEPKWCEQFETEKDKGEILEAQVRPMGREAAKAEQRGKHKKENVKDGIIILGENIEKIIKVEEDRKTEHDMLTEAQIQISNANLKAAKEQKEAKMFEVYNSLLNQDTEKMTEAQKASRDRAILKLEEKLFTD